MTKLEFVAENGNIRIDKYIADNEPSLTRTAAAKLIEQGKVFVMKILSVKTISSKAATELLSKFPIPYLMRQNPRTFLWKLFTRITICLL